MQQTPVYLHPPQRTRHLARALLRRDQRGHAERNHNVNLVRLLFLADLPAARAFFCNGPTGSKPDVRVRIQNDVSAFDQLRLFFACSVPRLDLEQ